MEHFGQGLSQRELWRSFHSFLPREVFRRGRPNFFDDVRRRSESSNPRSVRVSGTDGSGVRRCYRSRNDCPSLRPILDIESRSSRIGASRTGLLPVEIHRRFLSGRQLLREMSRERFSSALRLSAFLLVRHRDRPDDMQFFTRLLPGSGQAKSLFSHAERSVVQVSARLREHGVLSGHHFVAVQRSAIQSIRVLVSR